MKNKSVILAKIEGAHLKHVRSLHKPWCFENGAKRLPTSSWWGCSGCLSGSRGRKGASHE